MNYEDLTLEKQNGVAIVTLQRPEKMNAMGPRLVHELLNVLESTRHDDSVKAMVPDRSRPRLLRRRRRLRRPRGAQALGRTRRSRQLPPSPRSPNRPLRRPLLSSQRLPQAHRRRRQRSRRRRRHVTRPRLRHPPRLNQRPLHQRLRPPSHHARHRQHLLPATNDRQRPSPRADVHRRTTQRRRRRALRSHQPNPRPGDIGRRSHRASRKDSREARRSQSR